MAYNESANTDRAVVRLTAMNLLARREHSHRELQQKLVARYGAQSPFEEVLEELREQGLQSDERFAEAFFRSRWQRGQGPYRISSELKQRGIAQPLIDRFINDECVDWFERARDVACQRFRSSAPGDQKEWGKRARFLQYRGFSSEQVRYALESED
ncbi:regulatory protein RecX [bacterium SCSIO 12696]|nr:regulatory protein RecX [bacterium SCSIO 12696]